MDLPALVQVVQMTLTSEGGYSHVLEYSENGVDIRFGRDNETDAFINLYIGSGEAFYLTLTADFISREFEYDPSLQKEAVVTLMKRGIAYLNSKCVEVVKAKGGLVYLRSLEFPDGTSVDARAPLSSRLLASVSRGTVTETRTVRR